MITDHVERFSGDIEITTGDKVSHPVFGEGVVQGFLEDSDGEVVEISIDFGPQFRTKNLILAFIYSKLRLVEKGPSHV